MRDRGADIILDWLNHQSPKMFAPSKVANFIKDTHGKNLKKETAGKHGWCLTEISVPNYI